MTRHNPHKPSRFKRFFTWYIALFKRSPLIGRITLVAVTLVIAPIVIGLLLNLLFIALPIIFLMALARGPKGQKNWHISGQSDQEWAEQNDRRILGEDY